MITNYKIYNNPEGTHPVSVRPYDSKEGVWLNRHIPINEENREYQEYLAWKAEGNTPEEGVFE